MNFLYFLLLLSVVGLLRPYRTNNSFDELFTSDKIIKSNILDMETYGKYIVFHNVNVQHRLA